MVVLRVVVASEHDFGKREWAREQGSALPYGLRRERA